MSSIKYTEEQAKSIENIQNTVFTKHPHICKKIVPLSILGIEPRVFFHWKEKGIVDWFPDEVNSRQRIKLDLYDCIWITLVQKLRELGVSISDIKILKSQLHENIASVFKDLDKETLATIKEQIPSSKYNRILEFIQVSKKHHEEIEKFKGIAFTKFGLFISNIIMHGEVSKLLITKMNGEITYLVETDSAIASPEVERIKNEVHIEIPLRNLMEMFILLEKNEKNLEVFGFLNSKEIEVLDAIRNKEIKEINIKRDQFENLTFTVTKEGVLSESAISQIKRFFALEDYTEFRVVKRNDKSLFVESKTKKKI